MPAECAAFRNWAKRYLAASAADRPALLVEGLALAQARRAMMARLISEDPELALALAVPMVVRQQLPADVVAQLEERVSARGKLSVLGVTAPEGQTVDRPVIRIVKAGEQEYDAYVYGRRTNQATLTTATSILGVALDRKLALNESPVRPLEPGELADGRAVSNVCDISGNSTLVDPSAPLNVTAETAVEYNGLIHVLCQPGHVAQVEAELASKEKDHSQFPPVAADNGQGSSTVAGRPDPTWTHGTKTLLIIRVDFSDKPGAPMSMDTAVNVINGPTGVHNYYTNCSYGATNLLLRPEVAGISPDVTSVLRMPSTASYYGAGNNPYQLMIDAQNAATSAGYAVSTYDRVGVVFAGIGFGWSGLGELQGSNFWVQNAYGLRVVAHEIGHNYGLNHANFWRVTDGNPTSATGTSVEYGDIFDIMGNAGSFAGEFSHWNKSILQWIPDSGVLNGDNPGTYRIYRFDGVLTANLANPRALKVVRDATRDFWIGYRHGSGNASLNGGAYIVWGYNYNQQGNLLDMTTPGSTATDAGLAIGQSFYDAASGITIKPLAQGGSGTEEYLDVQISYQPRVGWSQTTFTTDAKGGHILLTVSRTKNSVGAISVNYATAAGTAVSPGDFIAQSGVVSWADGDMADKTIDVVLGSHAPAGLTKTFTVTLSGASGCAIWGGAAATANLLDAGVRDPGFLAYYISNRVQKLLPLPDGSMVVAGNFTLVYDPITYQSYSRAGLSRISATGQIDGTFAAGGGASGFSPAMVYDLARQPDGKIIAVGQFTGFNGASGKNYIVRLLADGSLDSSFNAGTGANGIIYSVLVQTDGKILIGGTFTSFAGTAREYLARLNANGSLDTTFVGPNFYGSSGGKVFSLALQPDGNLLIGGSFADATNTVLNLCRVTTTGALDGTFNGITTGANGVVNKVVLQPDGRILLAGAFAAVNGTSRSGLARLLSTGGIDTTFVPPAANGVCQTLLLEPDGSLLVGGASTAPRRLGHFASTGTIDTGFSLATDSTSDVYDIAVLANGRGVFSSNLINYQAAGNSTPVWEFVAGLGGLPGTVQFAATTASAVQGNSVTLTVTRTGGSTGALQVGYSTVPSSAHFTPTSGFLSWVSGDASAKTITVPLTNGAMGGFETCTVNLGQPVLCGTQLGAAQQAVITIVPAGPPVTGDFNGDRQRDIIWENRTTGEHALWLMNGTTYVGGMALTTTSPNLRVVAAADFNGDGKTDILLENIATGDRLFWMMNGTSYVSTVDMGIVSTVWHIAGTADFDGDGKPDILVENTSTGEHVIWLMNGTVVSSTVSYGSIPTAWRMAATADFNHDGQVDIVWENTSTGQHAIWLMNGTTFVSAVDFGSIPTQWRLATVGDFNGDGDADFFWENTATGDRALWLMHGTVYSSAIYFGSLPTNWHITP